jgi:hypothetical protein
MRKSMKRCVSHIKLRGTNNFRKENSQMTKPRLPTREISSGREARTRAGEQPRPTTKVELV